MTLSLEQVRHVAALARLSLTAEEEQVFQAQLSAILGAFEQLKALDTSAVPPTSHAGPGESVWRPDKVEPSLAPQRAVANAPERRETRFVVPKILD